MKRSKVSGKFSPFLKEGVWGGCVGDGSGESYLQSMTMNIMLFIVLLNQ